MKPDATTDATTKGDQQPAKRKRTRGAPKPRQEKPWPGFPLTWHPRGYWCKNRGGRLVVYEADALRSYDRYKDDLKAWERAEAAPSDLNRGHTVRDALNAFLTGEQQRHAAGKILDVQFAKYRTECERFAEAVGPDTRLRRLCGDDGPAVFAAAERVALARGLSAADQHFYVVRKALAHANRRGLMPPANFGEAYEKPTAEQRARARIEEEAEHGPRAWSNDELRAIVAGAFGDPHLFAQVLLGLNCAFGSDDCALLRDRMLDRRLHLIKDAYRGKTLRKRVSPLWPLTLWAVDRSRAARPAPADPRDADRVFLTSNGLPASRRIIRRDAQGLPKGFGRNDAVRQAFDGLLRRLQAEADGTSVRQRVLRLAADGFLDAPRSVDAVAAELARRKATFAPRGPGRACRALEAEGLLVRDGARYRTETFRAADGVRERQAARVRREDAERAGGRGPRFVRHKTSFYTLRAMCRTLMVGSGVDNEVIAAIKGQKFSRPVDEFYLRGDLRAKLFQATDHVFEELLAGWSCPLVR